MNSLNIKGVRLMRKTLLWITILLAPLVIFQDAFGAGKTRTAISPYIQTDNNSTYTFVGISHPSLNTAATRIGLSVATVGLDGTNPSTVFTIKAGQTYRVFIASTNHSTINSTTVTGARVIFLGTTTGGAAAGQLLFTANTVDPYIASNDSIDLQTNKREGLNQLSLWGAIVVPSTSTGFAMEFIGDAHDSMAYFNTADAFQSLHITEFDDGRGVN